MSTRRQPTTGAGAAPRSRMRPRGRRARAVVVTAAMTAGLAASVTLASAAGLNILAGEMTTYDADHPCPGPVTATTDTVPDTATSITITAPTTCSGKTLSVAVTDDDSVVQGQASASAGGTVVISLADYSPDAVSQVAVVVDGWSLGLASWDYTAPPDETAVVVNSSTGDITMTLGDWYTDGSRVCVPVLLESGRGNNTWQVDVNATAWPFAGSSSLTFTGAGAADVTYSGPTSGWFEVVGVGNWSSLHHVHRPSLSFNICTG